MKKSNLIKLSALAWLLVSSAQAAMAFESAAFDMLQTDTEVSQSCAQKQQTPRRRHEKHGKNETAAQTAGSDNPDKADKAEKSETAANTDQKQQ